MGESQGFEFPVVLTIVFIVLKLTHTIDWSWWWVFSPEWIVLGFAGIMFMIVWIIMAYTKD